MNYLVWAAFAGAFLVIVFSAYNSIASQGCKISTDQLTALLQDAGKLDVGYVQSRAVMLCAGTIISKDFVKSQMGFDGDVSFCVGRGVELKGDAVEVIMTLRADIGVYRKGSRAYVCINRPIPCETGQGC